MKKFISILILSIFIYNTFGFLATQPLLSMYYKYLGMQEANKPSKEEMIELLIFNKKDIDESKINFKWIHSHEFKYNGDMYDIVEKKETENQLIVYCINDTKEKKLEEEFEKKVQGNSLENKQRSSSNNFNFISISEAAQTDNPISQLAPEQKFKHWLTQIYFSPNLDIPSPPPKSNS